MEIHKGPIIELLKANPRGMTITDISDRIKINRNSVARYMDILTVSGQVEMRQLGPAKVFYLSQRVPISAFLNFSSDYILVLDNDLKITQVNENLLNLVNTERETILGRNVEDFPTPAFTSQEMLSRIREALDGKDVVFEKKLQAVERELYLNITMLPTIFEDGNKGVTLILQDTTERKRLESDLSQKNVFLNHIIESLSYPFLVIDAEDYTIKMANSASGIDLTKKQSCYETAHKQKEPCRNKHPCPLEKVKKTKKPVIEEHLHYDEDGSLRNVEVHGYPVFDDNGKVIQMIEYSLDITERKKAEDSLKNSEAKYRAYLENSPEYSYMISPDGKIVEVSKSALEVLGYSKEELLDKPLLSTVYAPSSQEKAREIFEKWKEHGKIQNQELDIITKGGEKRTVLLSAHSVKDANGKLLYSVSIQRDITKRKSLEEDLKQTNLELKERVKELTFLYKAITEMQKSDSSEDLGPKLVDLLVGAMQFPEIAAPVVEIEGERFAHKLYREDLTHHIYAEIFVNDHARGRVSIYYTEDRPFVMPQEQDMINSLAESLGGWLKGLHTHRSPELKQ
ncbi:MAG: PAS domain S-box protein [Candidatus Bathyarchaeota archaeon]|nr:PAS domain S-box protein [Candidatus Bathyarchaeota archaeon]